MLRIELFLAAHKEFKLQCGPEHVRADATVDTMLKLEFPYHSDFGVRFVPHLKRESGTKETDT